MSCCHAYALIPGNEHAFSIDTNALTFGRGCLTEAGPAALELGMRRVALFTDARVARTPHVAVVQDSLRRSGLEVTCYDAVHVEPTDASFEEAGRFAREGRFDGYVSVGGGSAIDTAKAANLLATHGGPLRAWVNAPVGDAKPVPGALAPHLACPTTSGTGSESTGIAVFDLISLGAKTGIASRHLKPSRALVDPATTQTLPANVVAASGFDVLCHALESFTARPYTARPAGPRPMSQGKNPWSDLGAAEALRLVGRSLVRAVRDESDLEAREEMMWAASLAGIAFGNAGVHIPHGMAYAVAGLVRDYQPPDYPADAPMIPHGISVVLNAPATFHATARTDPSRHLRAAELLGARTEGASDGDAGDVLGARIADLMKATNLPNGLAAVGYGESDLEALTAGAIVQKRLLDNAPLPVTSELLSELFARAMVIW